MKIMQVILEAILISAACSFDCIVIGFAYGSEKIKISFSSALLINIISVVFIGASLFLGSFVEKYISRNIAIIVCCCAIIFIGLAKIFSDILYVLKKSLKPITCNNQKPNINHLKNLNFVKSMAIAVALSLDGVLMGISVGLSNSGIFSHIAILVFSLIIGIFLLKLGSIIGNRLAQKSTVRLGWLGGLLLIFIALIKILL